MSDNDIYDASVIPEPSPFQAGYRPPEGIMKRTTAIGLLLTVLLVILICGGSITAIVGTVMSASIRSQVKHAEETTEQPSQSVSAEKLYQDFAANAVSAEESYTDTFKVTGTVKRVTSNVGSAVVVLSAGKREEVWCYFLDRSKGQVVDMKPGEQVSIVGRRAKSIVGVVSVSDCRLGI